MVTLEAIQSCYKNMLNIARVANALLTLGNLSQLGAGGRHAQAKSRKDREKNNRTFKNTYSDTVETITIHLQCLLLPGY